MKHRSLGSGCASPEGRLSNLSFLALSAFMAFGAASPAFAEAAFISVDELRVTIDWVTVSDPGNPCDPQEQGCFGSVVDVYRISRFETTNAQYAEFLNVVAATDTNDLYNPRMESDSRGGITRNGSSGSFSYSVKFGFANKPVNFVSFWDGLHFANWLHNGQPTGAQDNSTTEDGAYTITAAGIAANSIERNAGAKIFLTSEDEWYKAAYYDVASTSYFDFPAGTDAEPNCAAPSPTANTANCNNAVRTVTDVGAYTGSASPAGTFDQGGNLWEWNEEILPFFEVSGRGDRGSSLADQAFRTRAAGRGSFNPVFENFRTGFRVASVPSIEIEIDIKPGSDPNSINPSLEGDLPVAILGSDTFDVADVDVSTLAFGRSGAPFDHSQGPHFEDVNGDGFLDLVSHFRTKEAGIAFGDMEACLRGKRFDGIPFGGCDAITTVPGGRGRRP